MKFKELFDYLDKKCDFHEKIPGKPESITWSCHCDLRFTKEFCNQNKIDFEAIKKRLTSTGGYCDCEILFNSVHGIKANEELPKAKI